jgi:hypothetical protein
MIRRSICLIILFVLLSSQALVAQMFSVKSGDKPSDDDASSFGYSTLYFSVSNADLSFQGNKNIPGFIPLNFSGTVFSLGYENDFTIIEVSLGSRLTGISNDSEYFGIHFKNMRPLLRFGSNSLNVQVPIGIAFDYTRASDTRSVISANNLNQSGLMGGAGLKFVAEKASFYLSAGGDFFYGVSFADGSAFRGNTMRVNLPIRLMLKDLIGSKDLSFGATYIFKSIDVTNDPNERFDYDFSGIQIMIGLNF